MTNDVIDEAGPSHCIPSFDDDTDSPLEDFYREFEGTEQHSDTDFSTSNEVIIGGEVRNTDEVESGLEGDPANPHDSNNFVHSDNSEDSDDANDPDDPHHCDNTDNAQESDGTNDPDDFDDSASSLSSNDFEINVEINEIRDWAIDCGIFQNHLDILLGILRRRLLPNLPKSAKTFLETNTAKYNIIEMNDVIGGKGEFVYFGIKDGKFRWDAT